MDFDIKKPAHLLALFLMIITFIIMFVYPILTFAGFFPSTSDVEIPEIYEQYRTVFEIITIIMQLALIVFILIIIPFIWYFLVNNIRLKEIYSRIKLTSENVDIAFLWGVVAVIIIYAILFVIEIGLVALGINTENLSNIPDIEQFISFPSIFIVAAIQPIAEEIFFRGFLYDKIESFSGSVVAIFATSVLFGVAHMMYGELYPAIIPIVIGLILGYIVYRTKNLYSAITAHIIINVSSLILYYFAQNIMP